ncbi:hypothetical protein SAMD00019534_094800, partial [Acytostelium subglobosum LB1]|uniref:hypothetical protein n=1 Tax=Acytostelium subglobosum LB1 TaxID=1410327 RepID=UPI000644A376
MNLNINIVVLLVVSFTLLTCFVTGTLAQQPVACPGYQVSNLQTTSYGYTADLAMITAGPYGNSVKALTLYVVFHTQQIIQVKIVDAANERWQVPFVNQMGALPTSKPNLIDYTIRFAQTQFGFSITRVSTGEVIFNTSPPSNCSTNGLIFSEYYLEITNQFPQSNPNIYGLGERAAPLRLQNNFTYTIWNRDQATPLNLNVYGSHPFYLNLNPNGDAHGVFLLNSNAMDIVMQPNSLTYKVVGGVFDFYFFMGPSPASVIQQYTQVIGTPYMPSYWSLGWHQCRWGYKSVNESKTVAENYAKYGIPLETMWNDIDYMDVYQDFTLDPVNFAPEDMTSYVGWLHTRNQHYIMIIDPGIHMNDSYEAYGQLLENGAFIQQPNGVAANGVVWPGSTIFPDFFNPNIQDFWYVQLEKFHQTVPFDGVWIDMNEVSNFCSGNCAPVSQSGDQVGSYPNNPPYLPGGLPLDTKTLDMSSIQFGNVSYYNSHNLYGYTEGVVTANSVISLLNQRPTVISRSTFPGTGKHHAHWLGDNQSTYASMALSIPGILNMNMFGIGLVGADICGLQGDTTAQLCARWIQLGNFYPFSRSHNNNDTIPQEPYVFGPEVINITINSINNKYTLLPYYYTLFYLAHAQGDTIVRPLFFEYPADPNTFALDSQFLVGPSLMVSPVLTENATSVDVYFPQDIWYDYFNGSRVDLSQGNSLTLAAPLDVINVHLRGGAILPTQPTADYQVPDGGIPITTNISRTLPFTLIVALNANGSASGELYLDDGITLETYENKKYSLLQFNAGTDGSSTVTIQLTVVNTGFDMSSLIVDKVVVYGVPIIVTTVNVNGTPYTTLTYSSTLQTLTIESLALPLTSSFTIQYSN